MKILRVKFVRLFTNEHEQVLKNLGTFIEECFYCEDTTDPVDIIRLGELLQLPYIKCELIYDGI